VVAREHLDVLRQNGFELADDDESDAPLSNGERAELDGAEDDEGSPLRRGLRLIAQPISKNTVFDMQGTRTRVFVLWDTSTN
jgi:DNA mismatch repair protein PMS2